MASPGAGRRGCFQPHLRDVAPPSSAAALRASHPQTISLAAAAGVCPEGRGSRKLMAIISRQAKEGTGRRFSYMRSRSHAVVIRSAATLRRNPGNDLIGVGDVAGLAVHAIRRIQADALAVWLLRVIDHFVHIRRTEILTRIAELFHTASIADVGVVNDQMRRLVFFMLRS